MTDHIELDGEDVANGFRRESQERIALRLIGRVRQDGYERRGDNLVHSLDRVCEHSTRPLPYGCWADGGRSPYALYGAERWCDACIAYAALNGSLPRPTVLIEGTAA